LEFTQNYNEKVKGDLDTDGRIILKWNECEYGVSKTNTGTGAGVYCLQGTVLNYVIKHRDNLTSPIAQSV
jgi:hypothetical protein